MNIFERASRHALRFSTQIGDLTVEQLWDLPLTARREQQPDLDKIARHVHSQIKSLEEGSFVSVIPDPRQSTLELQLDVVKHIIADKIDRLKAAEGAAEAAGRKQKLLAALASKEDAGLQAMSADDLKAEIAKLSGA
jgi:hypothetical protein